MRRAAANPAGWLFHCRWGKRAQATTARGEAIEHLDIGGRTTRLGAGRPALSTASRARRVRLPSAQCPRGSGLPSRPASGSTSARDSPTGAGIGVSYS